VLLIAARSIGMMFSTFRLALSRVWLLMSWRRQQGEPDTGIIWYRKCDEHKASEHKE